LLKRRAERFLIRAERDFNEGDFDGTCFNSEQAIQLFVKAVKDFYGILSFPQII